MTTTPHRMMHILFLLVTCLAVVLADAGAAYGQSASCRQLQAALADLDRSGGGSGERAARDLQRQVQAAESRYIRDGCNDDARAGRQLSSYCQEVAQDVLALRDAFAEAQQAASAGQAVARQREAILQDMARFGCGTSGGSSATFSEDRRTLFDRIFGGDGQSDGRVVEDRDYWNFGGSNTVRTVCVRLSDGYFWPISYSTVQDYLFEDAQKCEAMCPNEPVELYFYNNPGQEPADMRNIAGQPYTMLSSAFDYRESYNATAQCNTGGQSRPDELTAAGAAPVSAPVEVELASIDASARVQVPLPRPRPTKRGAAITQTEPEPAAETDSGDDMRIVRLDDRDVRVVGPETPYARSRAEGI